MSWTQSTRLPFSQAADHGRLGVLELRLLSLGLLYPLTLVLVPRGTPRGAFSFLYLSNLDPRFILITKCPRMTHGSEIQDTNKRAVGALVCIFKTIDTALFLKSRKLFLDVSVECLENCFSYKACEIFIAKAYLFVRRRRKIAHIPVDEVIYLRI